MKILGLGNDIIAISRIKSGIDRYGQRFLEKIYTHKEQEYCLRHHDSARHFAGRFAAKEAVVKALGVGFRNGLGWHDIEIINDDMGKPIVLSSKRLNDLYGNPQFMISISHCKEFASAVALWVQ